MGGVPSGPGPVLAGNGLVPFWEGAVMGQRRCRAEQPLRVHPVVLESPTRMEGPSWTLGHDGPEMRKADWDQHTTYYCLQHLQPGCLPGRVWNLPGTLERRSEAGIKANGKEGPDCPSPPHPPPKSTVQQLPAEP